MYLLEDKSHISRMNELSLEEQRKLILKYAKDNNTNIFFEVKKKKQVDTRNFHILTETGIILQRQEFTTYWERRHHILWSIWSAKSGKRIYADFGTVVDVFNKE